MCKGEITYIDKKTSNIKMTQNVQIQLIVPRFTSVFTTSNLLAPQQFLDLSFSPTIEG